MSSVSQRVAIKNDDRSINTQRCTGAFNISRKTYMVGVSSGQRVCEVAESVLDLDRSGARLTLTDAQTVVITNADSVSQLQLDAIQDEIPNLSIVMHGCKSSSSGFCIVLTAVYTPHPICSSAFFEIVTSIFLLIAVAAMSSVA